ncbi:MAG: ribulose-phosphate 3-epimerase [Deltaproteobacteria bacterium]|nr:ribulose-phosphate 3-epimerase [Deltaproteobacteria bacterium]
MINKNIKIAASIICADWMNLEKDIRVLEDEKIDFIHYDVMDGFFVPDYCMGTGIINAINGNTTIPPFYHLMVEEPSRILKNFTTHSSAVMSIHYEACRNLHRDIITIKKSGFGAGIVVNPATPLNALEYVIEEVQFVVVMTVNPGYPGQGLVPQTLNKIQQMSEWKQKNNLALSICVEGNVNHQNIPKMVAAGCDVLIAGTSGLFMRGLPLRDSISKMRDSINAGLTKQV